jgi:DNA-binding LacI/PurR family transcriptional regulator
MTKLHDVAEMAGVSASTVSRAIHEPQMVNARTRARVQDAIRALGYRPSRVARRLRVERGSSNLIGLVIPDIQNPFFADLARGVEDVAQQHGYAVFLGNSDEDIEKERRYLDVMLAEAVDGVILPPCSERDAAALELARSGTPLVCVDRRLARAAVDMVLIDNVRGAYAATEHLIGLGQRRIGFIVGPRRFSTSNDRLQGYRQALADHGIEVDPTLVREGDSRQGSGRQRAHELLALANRPTALLVGNSMMTLGAMEAIREAGLRIPDDVALVGYDDVPWSLAVTPPLTLVRQPAYELGQRGMELLLQRLRDPERSKTIMQLQPELVIRESCGAGSR